MRKAFAKQTLKTGIVSLLILFLMTAPSMAKTIDVHKGDTIAIGNLPDGAVIQFVMNGGTPVFGHIGNDGTAKYAALQDGQLEIVVTVNGSEIEDYTITVNGEPISDILAERDIDNQKIAAGGTTQVTVEISNSISRALSLKETLPAGWTLTRGTDDADTFKDSTNEWVWFNVGAGETKTVTYTLNVPSDAAPGTYNIAGTVSDEDGVIANVGGESTVTVTSHGEDKHGTGGAGGTGSSSSGTGGGVVVKEPMDNIEKYETRDMDLVANKPVVYSFRTPELAIYKVVVTGKNNEYDVSVRVDHLKGTSKLAGGPAPGVVYANENVWSGSKRINDVIVKFRVKNSWINDNGLKASDIKLFRWEDGQWKQLESKVTGSDAEYTYFESNTIKLSIFAISGVTKDMSITKSQTTPQVEQKEAAETATETKTKTEAGQEKSPGFEIVAVIVAISAVYIFGRKRR